MKQPHIIIVGAGAAGLYGAYLLKAQGAKVTVLEARSHIGGRIQSFQGFAKHPIDLGAAYLHGHNHVLYELATYLGRTLGSSPRIDWYFWEKKLMPRQEARKYEALREAITLFPTFFQYKGPDMPVSEYIKGKKCEPAKVILDGVASEYGTDLKGLGMQALAEEERLWPAVGGDYHIEEGMASLLSEFSESLKEDIRLNTEVVRIEYMGEKALVHTKAGECLEGEAVLLTVPLGVLKARMLQFSPELPLAKQEAIRHIGFGPGSKVFLYFNEAIWPKDFSELYGGKFCTLYETIPFSEEPILVAYAMGESATRAMAQDDETTVKLLLEELDEIFGDASSKFLKAHTVHWANEPHIWGAYSYAAPNALGMRKELFEPVGRLFFAGEAAHYEGFNSTVQGAMETAAWAVERILSVNAFGN
jgi:monoamine oxidase